MPIATAIRVISSLWGGALLVGTSLSAVPVGTRLDNPDDRRRIVQAQGYRLLQSELRPEVEVVIFFYSASWCAPCKQAAKALSQAYPDIITAEPRIEVLTYSVDFSADARADYLRAANYPWPAIAPERIGKAPWPDSIAGGTPQFQAFAISEQGWQAITTPGDAPTVFKAAFTFLAIDNTDTIAAP
ncbi:redoxin domain-containing protein [Coraliomargarita sp. SDUM461003]|uniref:Redoxin domain-containing protein n=1 Tax=Thalassobacterium maritimum TaxID=3041265 RepID=A0ABU1AU81_9BACT|nr:redoxin domain-containing protein [Coraliomargarita sp. SDUM461003]MDQ8207721.1 redoxin domain-containing protein [Coraliomargarita sp. SDUM461003]